MLIHIIFKLGSYCVKESNSQNKKIKPWWGLSLDFLTQAFDLMCLHVDFSLNTVWWIELLIDAVAI